jgi:hypothetical protein
VGVTCYRDSTHRDNHGQRHSHEDDGQLQQGGDGGGGQKGSGKRGRSWSPPQRVQVQRQAARPEADGIRDKRRCEHRHGTIKRSRHAMPHKKSGAKWRPVCNSANKGAWKRESVLTILRVSAKPNSGDVFRGMRAISGGTPTAAKRLNWIALARRSPDVRLRDVL